MLEYLESDEETSCCYIADGAESQQREFLGQMLSRRVNGLVELRALDLSLLKGKTAEAQAQAFHSSLEDMAALMERAGLADPRAAQLLRRFLPSCTMNDRASTARRAARLILGVNPDDIEGNDPTCAEHALVNILEAGRMGMDAVLRKMMDISDEQAETDAAKIKAMRTCVGWFSSPACALIYQVYALSPAHIVRTPTLTVILSCVQVAKYVALCSTKGYAIGQKFLEWMEARLADAGDAQILLGHSEDLLAICGSRRAMCSLLTQLSPSASSRKRVHFSPISKKRLILVLMVEASFVHPFSQVKLICHSPISPSTHTTTLDHCVRVLFCV